MTAGPVLVSERDPDVSVSVLTDAAAVNLVADETTVQLTATPELAPVIITAPYVTGPRGPAGPTGPVGGFYHHEQSPAAAVWDIVHNLGHRPNVSAFNSFGAPVEGVVNHIDANHLTITYLSAEGGTADLS